MGLFFINLCNFASQQPEVSNELKHWLYVLKNMHLLDEEDYARQEGIFRKLMDECRIDNLTTTEMKEYKKSIWEYIDVKSGLEAAKRDSYIEGKADGISVGIAEGEAKGKAEERLNMAKAMLLKGVDIEIVVSITGLSEEEIKS